MMPKFRAWDEVIDQMFIPDSIHFDSKGMVDGIGSKKTVFGIEDFELMQSTGLYDKNGKEIFEGDILEVSYDDIHGEFCGCDVVAKNPFDYSLTEASWLNHAYEIKIIGNIHEHPGLLGEDGE